jgi:hypothetical protein
MPTPFGRPPCGSGRVPEKARRVEPLGESGLRSAHRPVICGRLTARAPARQRARALRSPIDPPGKGRRHAPAPRALARLCRCGPRLRRRYPTRACVKTRQRGVVSLHQSADVDQAARESRLNVIPSRLVTHCGRDGPWLVSGVLSDTRASRLAKR